MSRNPLADDVWRAIALLVIDNRDDAEPESLRAILDKLAAGCTGSHMGHRRL